MTDLADTTPVPHGVDPDAVVDPDVVVDPQQPRRPLHPRRYLEVALIHLRRVPLYWLRVLARSPIGAARLAGRLHRWAADPEGLAELAGLADNRHYYKVSERHDAEVRRRRRIVAGGVLELVLVLAGAAILLEPVTSAWTAAAVLLGVLTVLGLGGRSSDAPIVGRVVTADSSPPITSDLILTALGSLGIGQLNSAINQAAREGRSDGGLGWPRPIREEGKGWRANVDLPPGVTAGDVIERRDRLASGLRRPLSSVWPEADHEQHAGRLILYVAHQPLGRAKQSAWPLLHRGAVDLFEPFPVGVNVRGRSQTMTLMFALAIIGALPRMGKTFFLRLLALAAALDPTAELHLYDMKGGADYLPLGPVAHRFRVGDEPEDLAYLLEDLRALSADMGRRYKRFRTLGRDVCPEGKVTRALADNRALGLWPVVLIIDECQMAFDDNPEIVSLVTDLGKRGPAAGIMVLLATQRVDAKSLPTSISSNAVLRFCLKVAGQIENDMVLGTSSYKGGVRATTFDRRDVGIGYLAGEGADPLIVRGSYIDAPAAEKVVARARAARLARGLLTGHAVGEDYAPVDELDQTTILDHLANVWPHRNGTPAAGVWWSELAKLLAAHRPAQYAGFNQNAVREASGLPSEQVKATVIDDDNRSITANRRGALHEDLLRALAARPTTTTEERSA